MTAAWATCCDVGVGEDDQGRMTAQLEAEPLDLVGRAPDQLLADFGRAGEADLADRRVLEEGVGERPWRSPITRLATPGGRPASARHSNIWIRVSGVWSAGRLTTVQPDGQRRGDLPAGQGGREVPGRDRADDADRMLDRVMPLGDVRGRDDPAVGALALLGEPLEGVGGVQDLGLGLGAAACPAPWSASGRSRRPARASARRSSSGPWPDRRPTPPARPGSARAAASIARSASARSP